MEKQKLELEEENQVRKKQESKAVKVQVDG